MRGTSRNLGALDLNADFLKQLKLLNPNLLNKEKADAIISAFRPLKNRNINSIVNEVECSDRRKFDATILRTEINNRRDEIKRIIANSLQKCEFNFGYSGLRRSNQGVRPTDIQHSSFFGEWMNLASWLISDKIDLFSRAVFNERGHLLYSPDIINDIDDD